MNTARSDDYADSLQLFAAYGRAVDLGADVDEIVGYLADDPVIMTPGSHRFEGPVACRDLLVSIINRLHRSSSSVQHRYSDVYVLAEPAALVASANLVTTIMISASDVVFPNLQVAPGDRYELSQRVEARLVRKGGDLVFAEMNMIALWARVEHGSIDLVSSAAAESSPPSPSPSNPTPSTSPTRSPGLTGEAHPTEVPR